MRTEMKLDVATLREVATITHPELTKEAEDNAEPEEEPDGHNHWLAAVCIITAVAGIINLTVNAIGFPAPWWVCSMVCIGIVAIIGSKYGKEE